MRRRRLRDVLRTSCDSEGAWISIDVGKAAAWDWLEYRGITATSPPQHAFWGMSDSVTGPPLLSLMVPPAQPTPCTSRWRLGLAGTHGDLPGFPSLQKGSTNAGKAGGGAYIGCPLFYSMAIVLELQLVALTAVGPRVSVVFQGADVLPHQPATYLR